MREGGMISIPITEARKDLSDIFNKVAFRGERIVIYRHGKERVAMVPIEEAEALEALEDKIDVELAVKALNEPGEPVALEDLKAELGL